MKKQSLRKVFAVTAVVAVLSLSAPLGGQAQPLKPDAIGEFSGMVERSVAEAWSFFSNLWVALGEFWSNSGAGISGDG